jgi:plasmid stabilization system protein ParE
LTRFVFHPQARTEIKETVAWYDRQGPGLGDRFQQTLEKPLSNIENHPLAYPKVRGGRRRILLRKFPYAIIYRPVGEMIYVFACIHHKRNPKHRQRRP